MKTLGKVAYHTSMTPHKLQRKAESSANHVRSSFTDVQVLQTTESKPWTADFGDFALN